MSHITVQVPDVNDAIPVAIRIVEVEQNEEFDTYPDPDPDFQYEDPYVTEEEMLQINGETQVQKPRKPASAYFYYVKKHQCSLKQQHPNWPMKKIVKLLAVNWAKTTQSEREVFVKMSKKDSERYKNQMETFVQSDSFKKIEKTRKRRTKLRVLLNNFLNMHFMFDIFFDICL